MGCEVILYHANVNDANGQENVGSVRDLAIIDRVNKSLEPAEVPAIEIDYKPRQMN